MALCSGDGGAGAFVLLDVRLTCLSFGNSGQSNYIFIILHVHDDFDGSLPWISALYRVDLRLTTTVTVIDLLRDVDVLES
jgi:hypothetical protein